MITQHTPPVDAPAGQFYYFVNLNERGCFYADVRDEQDNTVYEIFDVEHVIDLIENGYVRHMADLEGLRDYLIEISVIPAGSILGRGQL